ncbi:hypothetical protein J6590_096853 [Homalodisca vitripennis]|nr:hypothetical protein J6590_096853 [Homalodisca vitripennis]
MNFTQGGVNTPPPQVSPPLLVVVDQLTNPAQSVSFTAATRSVEPLINRYKKVVVPLPTPTPSPPARYCSEICFCAVSPCSKPPSPVDPELREDSASCRKKRKKQNIGVLMYEIFGRTMIMLAYIILRLSSQRPNITLKVFTTVIREEFADIFHTEERLKDTYLL